MKGTGLAVVVLSVLLASETRGEGVRTVPKDPGFVTRLLGRGHPAYVTRALRQARQAPRQQRQRILNAAFKAGLRRGDLTVYSVIKLAKKLPSDSARNVMLRTYAQVNRDALSVKQAVRLGWSTTRYSTHRRLLESFRAHNAPRLSQRDNSKLAYEIELRAPRAETAEPKAEAASGGGAWWDPLGVNPVTLEAERRKAADRFANGTSGGTLETLRDAHTMGGNHEAAARMDQANAALNGDFDAMIQAGLRAAALRNNARFNPFK